MSTIVTRQGKGAPLSFTEMDANFNNLNNDKLESSRYPVSWKLVSEYASLTAAIASIGATETDLIIDEATTLTSNSIIPSTMKLRVVRSGSINQGAYTLTINGSFECGLYQAFTGTGAVTFGTNSVKEVYPQWWGASIYNSAAINAVAFQSAINSLTISGGIVLIAATTGNYTCDNITKPDKVILIEMTKNSVTGIGASKIAYIGSAEKNNLLKNSSFSLCTKVPLVRLGNVITITGWSNPGTGAVKFTSSQASATNCEGLIPGKLVLIESFGTPRAPLTLVSGSSTTPDGNTQKITCASSTFTGVEIGDIIKMTGGTNTNTRLHYRITDTDADTYITIWFPGAPVESGKTYSMTFYEGAKDLDSTVNGMPSTGAPGVGSAIGYPLQVTETASGNFSATLAGDVTALGATSSALAWEVAPGIQVNNNGDGPDTWLKSNSLTWHRLYKVDIDGTTPVTTDGEIYSIKMTKGIASVEYFYSILADSASKHTLEQYFDKQISFGAIGKASSANKCRAFIYDGTTFTYSDYYSITDLTWKEVSMIIPNTATKIWVGIELLGVIDDTFILTQPMAALEVGYIGEKGYRPYKGNVSFDVHPNFPRKFINATINSDQVIRIEQESMGAIGQNVKGIHIGLEASFNAYVDTSSWIRVSNNAAAILPALTMYAQAQNSLITFNTGQTSIPASSTYYLGSGSASTSEGNVIFRVPFGCILKNMYVQTSASTAGARTYTLRKNSVNQSMVVNLNGAATNGADTTNAVTLSPGDYISVMLETDSAMTPNATHQIAIGLQIVPTSVIVNSGYCPIGTFGEVYPSGWSTKVMHFAVGNVGWQGINIDMFAVEI